MHRRPAIPLSAGKRGARRTATIRVDVPIAERLLARVSDAQVTVERRLRQRIERARSRHAGDAEWQKIRADVERALELRRARAAGKPRITYPSELPVSQRAAPRPRVTRTVALRASLAVNRPVKLSLPGGEM